MFHTSVKRITRDFSPDSAAGTSAAEDVPPAPACGRVPRMMGVATVGG